MKKVVLSFVLIFTLGAYTSFSQSKGAYIEFEKTVHDYGKIKESNGPAVSTFTFKNTGTAPLVVTDVKPNCGCTTPEWTKKPIAPGQTGYVKASYDPKNRPGVFNKNIKVVSNAENQVIVLRIKGDVIPREKGVNDYFPIEMDNLRLATNHLALQKVYSNQAKTDTVMVYNQGDADLKVGFQRVPSHVTIKCIPEVVKPKGKAAIVVHYDASKKKDWGFVIDRIPIVFNDQYDPKKRANRLTISANIEEDFSKLTPDQIAKAPKVVFEKKVFNFVEITQGESASSDFKFKNEGKSDLIIRKVKSSCGCTAVAPETKVIKPGEESKISVTFRSRGKQGKQNKTITVITNDPVNPVTSLKVTGNVKLPQK